MNGAGRKLNPSLPFSDREKCGLDEEWGGTGVSPSVDDSCFIGFLVEKFDVCDASRGKLWRDPGFIELGISVTVFSIELSMVADTFNFQVRVAVKLIVNLKIRKHKLNVILRIKPLISL